MNGSDVTCAWCGRPAQMGERHGEGVCPVSAEQVEQMLADMDVQLLPWQREVLDHVLTGDGVFGTINHRRSDASSIARALAEACPSCLIIRGHAPTCTTDLEPLLGRIEGEKRWPPT